MITKTELKDIPGRACSFNNDVQRDVLEFHKSGWAACEVNVKKYKNAPSAFSAYKTAIKRLNVGVIPLARNDRLFLIRSE